jgi:glycosyltransferase involved in cell wall biosynthesis
MKFSVVIPALSEVKRIATTIDALKKQNVPRGDFEIIVVENVHEDGTTEVALAAGADKVVKEPIEGTNIARQSGVNNSSGEIVAFLDADCLPPPDWLEKIEKKLEPADVGAISGPYDYGYTGFKKLFTSWYFRFIFTSIPRILYFFFRKKTGTMMAGNFAAKRTTIDKIGGLPPLKFFGDDTAIANRISRQVGRVVFDPDLEVKSSSRRLDRDGFLLLTIRYAYYFFKIYFRD